MPRVLVSLLLTGVLAVSPVLAGQQGRTPLAVEMTVDDQEKMGVSVSPLVEVTQPVVEDMYATVVDVSALAALADELVVARAAVSASRAEADRLARLARQDQSASRQATEAAEAIAVTDGARLELAERRLGLEWGPAFVKMAWKDLLRMLDDIAHGDAALVRINGALGLESTPVTGQLIDPDGGGLVPLSILGVAATADTRFQGIGLLALASGSSAMNLRPGRVFAATVEARTETTGVVLARSALVRLDGSVWVYIHLQGSHFERRQVVDGRQVESGWFVPQGFKAGEQLVTEGAGALVALERVSETEEVD